MATPTLEQARFIVFILDTDYKDHSGQVFCKLSDAKEYARECIRDKEGDKAVVGMFVFHQHAKMSRITYVESIGFKGDKKDVNQLELFNY
jgi:hypothetical protein